MRINIGLAMSSDWCEYASITAASILYNANPDDDYFFYILSNGITIRHKLFFHRLNKIKRSHFEFIEIDNSYFEGAIHDWLGVSASYRLRFPSVTDVDKILYLDADIIAMKDIADLYSYNISNYYLAAVEDKCSDMMKSRVNLGEGDTFYNSGMQLINLKKYRELNLEKMLLEKLRSSNFYTDQDTLNDVCRGNILSLPLRYNIMPCSGYGHRANERNDALFAPVLVHFTAKPWKGAITHWSDKWHEYAKKVNELT